MVLLNSEVQCKNGQKGNYSLAVIIVYTSVTVFLVRSITTILTGIILEKKTQISRFQFKKLRFCSSDVSETFLYKKSRTQVKFFNHQLIASSN